VGGLLDDPTQQLPDAAAVVAAARRPRGRWAVLAVVVAVLALVAAGGAGYVAWQALTRAETALAQRAQPRPQPTDTGATSTDTESTVLLDPSAGPGIVARATAYPESTFEAGYAAEPLTFQIGCSATLFVDLDEPRANVDETHSDLRYYSRCGANTPTLALGPGADSGSQVAADVGTATDCEDSIRTSPLGPRAAVEVRKGVALCVLTSLADARERADTQKMVLLEVTALGDTGTASLRATSWIVRR
jgi:hypothetical protein